MRAKASLWAMVVEGWLDRAARCATRASGAADARGEPPTAQLYAAARLGAAELERRRSSARDRRRDRPARGPGLRAGAARLPALGARGRPIDLRLAGDGRVSRSCGSRVGSRSRRPGLRGAPQAERCAPAGRPAERRHRRDGTRRPRPRRDGDGDPHLRDDLRAPGGRADLRQPPVERPRLGRGARGSRRRALAVRAAAVARRRSVDPAASTIYATTAVVHERFEPEPVLALRCASERITLVSLVATTLKRLLDAGLEPVPSLRCALTGGGPVAARWWSAPVPPACRSPDLRPDGGLLAGRDDARGVAGGRGGARCDAPPGGADSRRGAGPAAVLHAGSDRRTTRRSSCPVRPSRRASHPTGGCTRATSVALDEAGRLPVTGRADTIVSGGENVAPAEVEAVLETHPRVLEAAVRARGPAVGRGRQRDRRRASRGGPRLDAG